MCVTLSTMTYSELQCSLHLSVEDKLWWWWSRAGFWLAGCLHSWLGSRRQVVIGVIYHLWKGLRAHRTNHVGARCYSCGTARTHPHRHKSHAHKQTSWCSNTRGKRWLLFTRKPTGCTDAWVHSYRLWLQLHKDTEGKPCKMKCTQYWTRILLITVIIILPWWPW